VVIEGMYLRVCCLSFVSVGILCPVRTGHKDLSFVSAGIFVSSPDWTQRSIPCICGDLLYLWRSLCPIRTGYKDLSFVSMVIFMSNPD
jgi:hypothetical protein